MSNAQQETEYLDAQQQAVGLESNISKAYTATAITTDDLEEQVRNRIVSQAVSAQVVHVDLELQPQTPPRAGNQEHGRTPKVVVVQVFWSDTRLDTGRLDCGDCRGTERSQQQWRQYQRNFASFLLKLGYSAQSTVDRAVSGASNCFDLDGANTLGFGSAWNLCLETISYVIFGWLLAGRLGCFGESKPYLIRNIHAIQTRFPENESHLRHVGLLALRFFFFHSSDRKNTNSVRYGCASVSFASQKTT